MNNEIIKKLNSTDTIISSLPKLIEAFVAFYGEDERENIVNKFNNMLVIGYCKPEDLKGIVRMGKNKISSELIDEFFRNLDMPVESREKAKEIFFDNNGFDNFSLQPINCYAEYVNGIKNSYKKMKAISFLKEFYPNVTTDNIDKLIEMGEFVKLDGIIKIYNDTLEKYNQYAKIFEPYEKYIESCKELKNGLEKKYTKLLVDEFEDLFTHDELKQIENEFNSQHYTNLKYTNGKTQNLFGFSFDSEALIDAFSEKNEEILLTENSSEWKKDSILRDRIKYFKNLGIDLGDNYELYLNNPQTLSLMPPRDLVKNFINKRKKLNTQMMNEYYQSIEEYRINMKRIEQIGLLDKEHGYNANAYEQNMTFVTTNIKETENGMIMYPMLCVSMGGLDAYLDKNLIHELNHILELSLQTVEGNKYYGTCGWDLLDGEISNKSQKIVELEADKNKRNYELFNEIINELIAQEITNILFNANGYIFNTKDDAKIKGGTAYEKTKFIIQDFYDNYKSEIIESRKNGNIAYLFEKIGKDNFEALNELFHIFYEAFPGYSFYHTIQDWKNGIKTDQTQIYENILNKRNEILESMKEYSQKKLFLYK